MTQLPYGDVQRDLTNLCEKRVRDSIISVMQLGETPGEKLMIAIAGATAALSAMGGAWDGYKGNPENPLGALDAAEYDHNLSRLVELAKGVHMNDEQRNEQRNSFVYGNTKIENVNVTREMVEEISHRMPRETTRG